MNDIDDVYASAISDEEGFSDDDGVGIVYESARFVKCEKNHFTIFDFETKFSCFNMNSRLKDMSVYYLVVCLYACLNIRY